MSLAAVARRSGLSEQTLSTIEQGLGNPTVVTLAPLGGALDLPRRFLIEGVRRCTSSDTMKANGWMDPSGRSKCSMRSLAQVASEQYFSG
jgi:transcriptional regulator with XRE-family HTH domain